MSSWFCLSEVDIKTSIGYIVLISVEFFLSKYSTLIVSCSETISFKHLKLLVSLYETSSFTLLKLLVPWVETKSFTVWNQYFKWSIWLTMPGFTWHFHVILPILLHPYLFLFLVLFTLSVTSSWFSLHRNNVLCT